VFDTVSSKSDYIRPIYSFIENDIWRVDYDNRPSFIIDTEQLEKMINFAKRFIFFNPNDIYPSYAVNYKRVSLLEFLYGVNTCTECYTFKNENSTDMRSINVCLTNPVFYELTKQYNVVRYLNNEIVVTAGRYAGEIKNHMCEIKTSDDETQYLMMCNQDKLCKLCPISYEKILDYEKNHDKKIIWSYHTNGYILGNNKLFMHQVIMDCYGNGKGTRTVSVDHIDQERMNNTWNNLRIATRKEQEQNSTGIKQGTKRARKVDTHPYPEGITHDMLPKYIHYPKPEEYGTNGKTRTYFVVEKHPTLIANKKKQLMSSKSEKVSPEEKLQQAIDILAYLDKGEMPPEKEPALPKYYSLIEARGKPHLVYERRREDGTRMNVKMVLPEDFDMSAQVARLAAKVSIKYPEVVVEAK
jgi:hypothetical protein